MKTPATEPESNTDHLRERLALVQERIAAAAGRAQRSPKEITLVAISKTHPTELLRAAIHAGATDLGENRVQEAEPKITELGRNAARWHLVGHLQSNKARRAVQLFDLIHSVDSEALATRLDRLCDEEGREELPVMIQVDLGKESTKSGISESDVLALAKTINNSRHLKLTGLMTLPPFFDSPEAVRPYFRELRKLRDSLQAEGFFGDVQGGLSMGMTNDFEVAIEEGATLVRVGTAIFGERERLGV